MLRRENSRGGDAQDRDQVLGEHDADDVVDRVLVHRVARPLALRDQRDRVVERRVDRQRVDRGARRHHVARVLLRELEHALEQVGVLRLERAALLALLDEHAQLFGRVDVFARRAEPEGAQYHLRRAS